MDEQRAREWRICRSGGKQSSLQFKFWNDELVEQYAHELAAEQLSSREEFEKKFFIRSDHSYSGLEIWTWLKERAADLRKESNDNKS